MINLLLWMLLFLHPPIIQKKFPILPFRDTSETFIVLHNDSSASVHDTFKYLRRKRNSYHYYIDRHGTIYQLVDVRRKANHAGVSYYQGHVGMNDVSIGICLENNPPQPYTSAQYDQLAWLIAQIHRRFPDSQTHRILGHSDIAIPYGRKSDPGLYFSYDSLTIHLSHYEH